MKIDNKVIEFLNQVLENELVAVNQFFLHSRMYQNWGLSKVAEKEYSESIDEMKHADTLIQRILFLEGSPKLQMQPLSIGSNVGEILKYDLQTERKAIEDLRNGVTYCEEVKDFVSRDLLSDILISEEEHVDWLETQLDLIERIGLENYTQSQI